jgi:hypothetical protein
MSIATRFGIMQIKQMVSFCGLFILLPACGGAPGEEGSPEEIGTVREGLFEIQCFDTVAADATVSAGGSGCSGACGAFYGQTSVDGSYNHTNCANKYIVETNNISGKIFQAAGTTPAIASAPSEAWCEGFWASNEAMAWHGAAQFWLYIGIWTVQGDWQCDGGGNCSCREILVGGAWPPTQFSTHGYTKTRTVTQAGFANLAYVQARSGVMIWP